MTQKITYPSGTGLSTLYSYYNNSGDQRLETIQNLHSSTQLSKFDYTYNAVGTIASWTTQTGTSTAVVNTLGYDKADQLTSAVQSGGATAGNKYNYDPAGNRLAETTLSGTTVSGVSGGLFNNLNQLTSYSGTAGTTTVSGTTTLAASSVIVNGVAATLTGSTSFTATIPTITGTNTLNIVAKPTTGIATTQRFAATITGSATTSLAYDANGNTTTDENGNNYKWDALNRLTAIIYPTGPNAGTHSEFRYDGLSRRTGILELTGTITGSGTVTSMKNYLWVGSEIAEERDGTNTVQKRFFPQGEQQSGTNYYYTRDHLGSVREMCSSTGTITSRMSYDPYGRTTTVSGTVLPTKQYADMYWHQPSGLYLSRGGKKGSTGRPYDSNTGIWPSRDPIQENGGLNLYGYVGNDPVNFYDPLGLDNNYFHRASCCNRSSKPTWALVARGSATNWEILLPGQCITQKGDPKSWGGWGTEGDTVDCEGIMCQGGFYAIPGFLGENTCTDKCDKLNPNSRWVPGMPHGYAPWEVKAPDNKGGGPPGKGDYPPGYHYHQPTNVPVYGPQWL